MFISHLFISWFVQKCWISLFLTGELTPFLFIGSIGFRWILLLQDEAPGAELSPELLLPTLCFLIELNQIRPKSNNVNKINASCHLCHHLVNVYAHVLCRSSNPAHVQLNSPSVSWRSMKTRRSCGLPVSPRWRIRRLHFGDPPDNHLDPGISRVRQK